MATELKRRGRIYSTFFAVHLEMPKNK